MGTSKKPKLGCKRTWQDNAEDSEDSDLSDVTQAEEEELSI